MWWNTRGLDFIALFRITMLVLRTLSYNMIVLFYSHLKKLVESSRHIPEWILWHLAHVEVLVPLSTVLPCKCAGLTLKVIRILTIVLTFISGYRCTRRWWSRSFLPQLERKQVHTTLLLSGLILYASTLLLLHSSLYLSFSCSTCCTCIISLAMSVKNTSTIALLNK